MVDSSEDDNSQISGANSSDNLPRLPDGNVDVDQLKIKILLIGKSRKTADSIANYLVRRGWETTVNTNIKDAFQTVATFKPDFVMISVNLPTPKIHQLPTVMSQTFKIPSIIFGESGDTKTMGLMQKVQASYKIIGAISGPSAHRRIKQILQEIHHPQDAKQETVDNGEAEGNSIVVKGSAQAEQQEKANSGSSGKSRKPAYMPTEQKPANHKGPGMFIAKSGSGDSGDDVNAGGHNASDITGVDVAGDLEELAALFQSPDDGAKGMQVDDDEGVEPSAVGMTLEDILDHASESVAEAHGEPNLNSANKANGSTSSSARPGHTTTSSASSASQGGSAGSISESSGGSADLGSATAAGAGVGDPILAKTGITSSAETNGAASNSTPAEVKTKKEKKQYAIVEMFDVVTEIAKGCVLIERESVANTVLVEESTIIPIDSVSEKGYLFIGAIGIAAEENQFLANFADKLDTVLPREFSNIKIGKKQKIQFVALAVTEKIEGETKHLHLRNGAGEIYIKYIKESRYEAKVSTSLPGNKAEIDPKELVPNSPVGTEVYMHLPKNEKYYQYLKPRSSISDKQKEKLVSSSVKLYINKSSADDYRDALRKNKTLETIFDTSKRNKKAS